MVHAGYKGLIVAASFLAHFIFYGVVYGIGVYYVVIEETLALRPTQVSLLCSVFTALFFIAAPVSAIMINMFGCNKVMIFGGAVGSIGFALSSFSYDINVLYFTFAGITGTGLGFCGPPSVVIIGDHFEKKSPLAFGIALSGVGFGAFAFPAVVNFLVNHYGLSGSFLINGALCSHLILCGVIYRPTHSRTVKVQEEKEDKKNKDIWQLGLFKDINFLMLCLNNMLAGFGQSVVFVHLSAYAVSLGFSKNEGAIAISVMGIANWMGRLIFGVLPQIKMVGFFLPFCIGLALAAVTTVTITLAFTFMSFCMVSAAFGFFWATFGALQPQVTRYVVGQEQLACAFGYLLVFVATGSILGAPTAGYMFERTGSYPMSFYIGGGAIIGSAIAAILPGWRMRTRQKHQEHQIIETKVEL